MPAVEIVYLEDEPDILEVVHELLTSLGVPVHAAGNEAAAKAALLAAQRPFVLVTDWFVGGMSGEQVLDLVEQDLRAGTVRVVVTTGWPLDARTLAYRGSVRLLKKPCSAAELLQTVQAAMDELLLPAAS